MTLCMISSPQHQLCKRLEATVEQIYYISLMAEQSRISQDNTETAPSTQDNKPGNMGTKGNGARRLMSCSTSMHIKEISKVRS